MLSSILTIFTLAVTACHGQLTSLTSIVAPTTSIVTYKTIRCSTYYGVSKVKKVPTISVDITTHYSETIYPYVYSNSTTSVSTCYSQYTSAPVVNVAVATTRFPLEVYCTKSVEIIKATYVTAPTSTYTRLVYNYPTANPEGYQWAIYPNTQGADTDVNYSQFDPVVFQNITPWYHSSANAIGNLNGTYTANSGYVPIYNSSVAFNQSYFTINHRWYLHAPQTGTYSAIIPNADDIALLWVGPTAYLNWNRTNAVRTVTSGNPTYQTYGFQATAGDYIPMRVVYGQATDGYSFNFNLIAPDGSILLNRNSGGSQSIVQYSCSGYAGAAPPFPLFGDEEY